MKVLFLVRSLDYGGAQRQLVLLSKGLAERGHDVVIGVFYAGGELEKELRNTPVRLRPLKKKGRWDIVWFPLRLARMVREERPDILHGYLMTPNLLTVILKPLFPHMKVVWGVRGSRMDLNRYDWLAEVEFKLNCWLSKFSDAIIANSRVGHEYHSAQGYPRNKMVVIPNGVDTERFHPNLDARYRIRKEWGITDHDQLVGLVGRLDPMKDHPVFLNAAALLMKDRKHTRFVCVGSGPAPYRHRLQRLAKSLGLGKCLLWVPARDDMPAVYNALDVATSTSSFGEGLSNVTSEAMACGVPCVVTHVGDSAWLVGDQGEIVPPRDPVALKKAIEKLLNQRPYAVTQIRQRIIDELSVNKLVLNTEGTLEGLLRKQPSALHVMDKVKEE